MTTALLMLLGSIAASYASLEKGQEGQPEGGQAQAAKPAEQHTQQAKPAAAQEHASAANHAQQNPGSTNQSHATQSQAAAQNRGGKGGRHGRIGNAHWPVDWGYDDDVYVVYTDGGYSMYDRRHPGLRLSINIL